MGFCDGHLMSDEAGVLKADSGQAYIRHWVFEKEKHLDEELLHQYVQEAVIIKDHLAGQKENRK